MNYKKGYDVLTLHTFDKTILQIEFQNLKVMSQLTKPENYAYVSYRIYDAKKDSEIKLSFFTKKAYWR